MGLRLIGAIVVFGLIALGLWWIVTNVELKRRGAGKEDRHED
jgi:hypothetical protein